MAVVTAPARRFLAPGTGAGLRKAALRAAKALAPVRPVMKNLASYPLTVAMAACADIGAFEVFHHAGWFVLAASLAYLEHVLADE